MDKGQATCLTGGLSYALGDLRRSCTLRFLSKEPTRRGQAPPGGKRRRHSNRAFHPTSRRRTPNLVPEHPVVTQDRSDRRSNIGTRRGPTRADNAAPSGQPTRVRHRANRARPILPCGCLYIDQYAGGGSFLIRMAEKTLRSASRSPLAEGHDNCQTPQPLPEGTPRLGSFSGRRPQNLPAECRLAAERL